MPFAELKVTGLEVNMLSEASQTEKDKYHVKTALSSLTLQK